MRSHSHVWPRIDCVEVARLGQNHVRTELQDHAGVHGQGVILVVRPEEEQFSGIVPPHPGATTPGQ